MRQQIELDLSRGVLADPGKSDSWPGLDVAIEHRASAPLTTMRREDVFSYPAVRARAGQTAFAEALVERHKNSNLRNPGRRALHRAITVAARRASPFTQPRGRIAFVGSKFDSLLTGLSEVRKVSVFTKSLRESGRILAKRIPVVPVWDWSDTLHTAYLEAGGSTRDQLLGRVLSEITEHLSKMRPSVVILSNDSLFMERAMIYAANSLGIPVATIQHGLFMRMSDASVLDGRFSDHFLAWGEFTRRLYIEANIVDPSRIAVLGYPHETSSRSGPSGAANVVCILGQPWERYRADLIGPKNAFLSNVVQACDSLGLRVVYRPHPGEDRERLRTANSSGIPLTRDEETLADAFQRYDVFVSISSTALVDALLSGQKALQVLDPAFPVDDFEQIGACASTANEPGAIERALRRTVSESKAGDFPKKDYIEVPEDIVGRFDSWLRVHIDEARD